MFHIPLNIVPRKRWEALAPESVEPLSTPVPYVINTFTGSRECFSKEDCRQLVKEIQKEDMNSGLPDIRFNFLVGGDGTVFEGRGWQTNYYKSHPYYAEVNGKSVDFAYIGPHVEPYQRNYPSLLVKLTMQRLLEYGINNGHIKSSFNGRI